MAFVIYALDRKDAGSLRRDTRLAHLDYMIAARERILFGGPMLSDDGARTIGSVFALDHADRASVDRFLADEPYCKAGLFESVSISPMRVMVPEPRPGLLDEERARQAGAPAG